MYHRFSHAAGVLACGALLAACANNSPRGESPPAAAELAQARAGITQAEQAGAAEYGSAELALAREKLVVAEQEARDGNVERARQLAVEASLDADLAAAITRHRQTELLAEEVNSGLRTLEQELRRGVNSQTTAPRGSGSAGELR